MTKNFYEILNIKEDASQAEIKDRFRSLALEVHPDINISSTALEKFVLIKEAYDTLTNSELRANHDRALGIFKTSKPASSFKDTSHQIFRDKLFEDDEDSEELNQTSVIHPQEKHAKSTLLGLLKEKVILPIAKNLHLISAESSQNENKWHNLNNTQHHSGKHKIERTFVFGISTLESIQGTSRQIVLSKGEKTIQVKIPAGVEDGSILRMMVSGGQEIKAKVNIQKDTFLSRNGSDVTLRLPFLSGELKEGYDLLLYTLTSQVKVNIPSSNTRKIRLKGHGLIKSISTKRGDLFIEPVMSTGNAKTKRDYLCELLKEAAEASKAGKKT